MIVLEKSHSRVARLAGKAHTRVRNLAMRTQLRDGAQARLGDVAAPVMDTGNFWACFIEPQVDLIPTKGSHPHWNVIGCSSLQ
jgi:hypothetical protein